MIRFLVERPVAVLVSFFALLLLGITAYLRLPVSLMPDTAVPVITVRLKAPNYSAQETEQRLTAPMRNSLLQLRGLADIESTSSEGQGVIRLRFDYGMDISMAFIEVNEKVDMIMNRLPRDAERPLVVKSGVSDIPVFRLNVFPQGDNVSPGRMAEVSSFAREIVRRRIEQLPEVAMVDLTGLTEPQVEIVPKSGYLESLGLRDDVLLQAFRENQTALGNILVSDGHYRYYLRFSADAQHLEAIRNMPLNISGRLLRLADLSTVTYTNAEAKGGYYNEDRQAVNFAVIKRTSARMDDLKTNFHTLLEQLRRDYPEVGFELTQDQTRLLDYSMGNLQQDLLLGGCLAFVLMLMFIRKLRMALLIGITVPLSLMVSLLGFYLLGISLNIISLGGLILGLSMIIDNSIVVMDTIAEQRSKELFVSDAAIAGTNEIIRPLITSVLTNCAVFIPLIFLSGLAGAIFYDQAISIVVGVISSMLVAILLLPPLYRLMYDEWKWQRGRRFEIRTLVDVTRWYDCGLRWSFRHPALVTLLVMGLFAFGGVVFFVLDKNRLPDITRHDFEVSIDWNEQLSAGENERRVQSFAQAFADETWEINAWAGEQQYLLPLIDNLGYTQCRLYLHIADASVMQTLQPRIDQYLRERYPQALVMFHPAKNAFDEVFTDEQAPLRVMLSDKILRKMPPLDTVEAVVRRLDAALPHARINSVALYDKVVLTADPWQAARYGVDHTMVAAKVEAIFRPQLLGDFQGAEALVPIVLVNPQLTSIHNILAETFVVNDQQQEVPLASLVSVSRDRDYKYLKAGIQGEYYPIAIHTNHPEADLPVVMRILQETEGTMKSDLDGSYFDNYQLINQMVIILLVSVLLLYFILAAQFESLVQPLFILAELPVAICGAFVFIYIGNSSVNLMSMIGIIVMSGLIINDSILKIDAINQLRRKGMPLTDAIFEGGHKRLRPIIMISLTSIGALAPTLFMSDLGSELQKPLALALIGGMVVGLLISLFFVPIIYWAVYRKKEKS